MIACSLFMKCIDLFSGCGGLSLGFERAGHEIVGAFDVWKPAIEVYNHNFKHQCRFLDMSDLDSAIESLSRYDFNSIIGGPPCQDFSHAGLRTEGKRANLTVNYSKIVSHFMPEWFVMENVDRAMNSSAFASARNVFKSAGYGLNERVLDASYCGVPQKRKRLFVIGRRGASDGFLNAVFDASLSAKPLTPREYMGEELGLDHYYRHPRNYSRRGVFSVDEPAPTVRGVNRPIPKGYPGHHGDTSKLTPELRPLTTKERARLQTFPASFILTGTKTNLEQLIGNAVPVELAAHVGNAIASLEIKESRHNAA